MLRATIVYVRAHRSNTESLCNDVYMQVVLQNMHTTEEGSMSADKTFGESENF